MDGWPLLLQNKDFIDLEIHDTLVPHPTRHSPSFIEKKSLLFCFILVFSFPRISICLFVCLIGFLKSGSTCG